MNKIKEYLLNKKIQFKESGKNVIRGNINICCPFCGEHKYHRTIFPDGWSLCWICDTGKQQFISKIIQKIEGCNWQKANKISENLQLNKNIETEEAEQENKIFTFPKEFTKKFPIAYRKYLESRNFDFYEIEKHYDIYASPNYGKDKFRIIAPIKENGKIVSWVGRDTTNKQEERYRFCPDYESLIPRSDLVYNIDKFNGNTCIIVEGITDVWRIGINCVALLSIRFTKNQILKLKNKGLKKAYIMFDNEEKAQQRAKDLEGFLTFCDVFHCDIGDVKDPAELSEEDVKEFKRIIF